MTLTFGEKRAQSRQLGNINFFLNPERLRHNSDPLTIKDLERVCGPIRGVKYDVDLFYKIMGEAIDRADGFLVEYAGTMGYMLNELHLPQGYSLVSRLPKGDPGKELEFTLSVLQLIIDGNEAFSTRADITERLEMLIATKAKLENAESEFTNVLTTLEERIANCQHVSREEIEEFTDQIEKDESYQVNLSVFVGHEYLLKGVKHAQFLQMAFKKTSTTINKSYYDSMWKAMISVVNRLSNEEVGEVVDASEDYFKAVTVLKRDYAIELKDAVNNDKKGVFTSRVLLFGPKAAVEDLAKYLSYGTMEDCIHLLSDMPTSIYKMMFEAVQPLLLVRLFTMKDAEFNYTLPMKCIVRSGIFPLHKLLTTMHRPVFGGQLTKIFSDGVVRDCLIDIDISTPLWEETLQPVINCLSIVATPMGMTVEAVKSLLHLMKSTSRDESATLEWLSKYQNYEKVSQYIGEMPTPDVSTKDSTSQESTVDKKKEGEEAKKDDEKKKNEQVTESGKKKKKKRETPKERKVRQQKERETEDEERRKKNIKDEEEREKKKKYVEEKNSEDKKKPFIYECHNCGEEGHQARDCKVVRKVECYNCGQEGHRIRKCTEPKKEDILERKKEEDDEKKKKDDKVSEALADDNKKKDKTESEQKSIDLIEMTCDEMSEKEGDDVTKEKELLVPDMPAPPLLDEDIYPDRQNYLPIRDEPLPGRREEMYEYDEDEIDNERLAATQGSATSQNIDGIARSLNDDFNHLSVSR